MPDSGKKTGTIHHKFSSVGVLLLMFFFCVEEADVGRATTQKAAGKDDKSPL